MRPCAKHDQFWRAGDPVLVGICLECVNPSDLPGSQGMPTQNVPKGEVPGASFRFAPAKTGTQRTRRRIGLPVDIR